MSLLYNQKTLVMASHSVGKTHGAAGLVLWHYHCFNPSITLTTAPTDAQVVDLLWKEIREQAPQGTALLPRAPEISDPLEPHHYAKGYVARDANSFQGRHEENLLIIFDEAVGVLTQFWDAAEGMLTSGETNRWLAILNPTDTSSRAYAEYDTGNWNVLQISALTHPNILAELTEYSDEIIKHTLHEKQSRDELLAKFRARPTKVPYPKAVRLSWLLSRLAEWTTLRLGPHAATDIEFPPGSGIYYSPGPLFEGRVIGRWPSKSTNSIWSEALFDAVCEPLPDREQRLKSAFPTIGCDVARFGNDLTAIHVQANGVALHHESHNGWSTAETAGRLKQLADEWGAVFNIPGTAVNVLIDDDGVGGGVVDQAGDYNFLPRSGATTSTLVSDTGRQKYPNRRSEVWFEVAELARNAQIDLSALDTETQHTIRRQLLAPLWSLDSEGRQVVERKAVTKKRLDRSPDDADAFNLAHAPLMTEGFAVFSYYKEKVNVAPKPKPQEPEQSTGRDPWSRYNSISRF